MSVASDLLTAVQTIVQAAFPGAKVYLRRASQKNPIYAQDMSFTGTGKVFAASINEDRGTSMAFSSPTGPQKFVEYPLTLTYLTKELPGNRDASPDVETTLATAAALFLASRTTAGKPGLQGVPAVNTCAVRPLAPYTLPMDDQTVNCSPLLLTFETIEPA